MPEYRGGNPYSRVIINGEKETGVTIHFMSENFDEGDIVAQIKCPVDEFETMGTIYRISSPNASVYCHSCGDAPQEPAGFIIFAPYVFIAFPFSAKY